MALSLRPIQPGDDPGIARVIRSVMPEFGCDGPGFSIHDPEVAHMWEAYHRPRSAYWVVTDGKEILGGAGYAPLEGGDAETCELKKMYFLPAARGSGFGDALMRLILEHAARDGFRTVYIETVSRMIAANTLYRKHGFLPLERPLGDTGHGGCNTFYSLSLSLDQ